MTERIKVGVLFGGRSNEHSISCVSAASVLRNLDPRRFDAVPVGITREGTWVLLDADPAQLEIRDRVLPQVRRSGPVIGLASDPAQAGAMIDLSTGAVVASVDVVFPVLHGAYGEDGTIQGQLEMSGVPYVGAGVLSSATAMDKEFTKKLLAAEGLPIGRQEVLRADVATLTAEQRDGLGLPVFVKPARGGSSIGISRVSDWADLDAAIAEARKHDPKVIVEAAVVGREVECGVLEYPDGRVDASVVAEIRMPDRSDDESAFYDFDTKYLDDGCEFDVPAKLDDAVADDVRELATAAFRALDCQGLARVDFFVTDAGPVINEVNTMPGFTQISMFPRMWEAAGVDFRDLITAMVDTALARGTGLR
ncbi:D-alanine--D-alanine ligase [Skermania sp. ID1734]|uniref:D-alanine--D-alanine ligase family protein n=1 Tax=Skermania sp. ID1734 TaxID=2597516 RepID=UPI00117F1B72|nr:D-alanine--D-alanine ligase family protein [Skermania sp. ID1734]TSE01040.1 D-alanine--D-alanine ligase [Skermania sp. ID1734]